MTSFNQSEIVSHGGVRPAGEERGWDVGMFLVLWRYHFSEMIGHHILSSLMKDVELISGMRMSPGTNVSVCVLAKNKESVTMRAIWFLDSKW